MTRLASLIVLMALALLALASPLSAAGPPCGTGGQLIPAGYQKLTISTAVVSLSSPGTAVTSGVTSIPTNAIYAVAVVRTNAINATDDGSTPTVTAAGNGMPYAVSGFPQTLTMCGVGTIAGTKLIRQTADSVVDISYYTQ